MRNYHKVGIPNRQFVIAAQCDFKIDKIMKKLKSIKGIPLKYIQSIVKIDSKSPSGLTWLLRKDTKWNGRFANKMAGWKQISKKDGYKCFRLAIIYNKKLYYFISSRVVFFLHNGYLTEGKEIDHIDRNSLNNNPSNLRELFSWENQQNKGLSKKNNSGHADVVWNKSCKKWMVRISINKKRYYFGIYEKLEDAIKVAVENRKKLHGEFGRDK